MKKLLLILLLAPLFTVSACAEGVSGPEAGFDVEAMTRELPEEAIEIGGELRLDGSYDSAGALERLWNKILASLAENLRSACRVMVGIFALILLCAVSSSVVQIPRQNDAVQIAGCAAVSLMLAGGMNSLFAEALTVLSDLDNYGRAVLPAVYTAAAASGAVASSSAKYGLACLAVDLMMEAAQRLIIPLICAVLAMSVCAGLFDNALLRTGIKLGKRLTVLLLSGLTLGFTAFLSITGLVSGSADALTVKAARSLIATAVPVVGRMLSDTADSVLTAASLVKNSAGAFGMIAVCAVCAAPFVSLAVHRLLLSVAAAAAEMMAGERLARLLNDLGGVMSMLLGLVGCFGLMLFFCIVAALRTVSG